MVMSQYGWCHHPGVTIMVMWHAARLTRVVDLDTKVYQAISAVEQQRSRSCVGILRVVCIV